MKMILALLVFITMTACQKKKDDAPVAAVASATDAGKADRTAEKPADKPEGKKVENKKVENNSAEEKRAEEKKASEKCDAKPIEKAIVTVEEQSNHKTNGSTAAAKPSEKAIEKAKLKMAQATPRSKVPGPQKSVKNSDTKAEEKKDEIITAAPLKLDENHVLLTEAEVRLYMLRIKTKWNSLYKSVIAPIPENSLKVVKSATLTATENGTAHFVIQLSNSAKSYEKTYEVKDMKLNPNIDGVARLDEVLLVPYLCIDAKCDLIFIALQQSEVTGDEKNPQLSIQINMPFMFKKVDGKFKRAIYSPDHSQKMEKDEKVTVPPKTRVVMTLEINSLDLFNQIHEAAIKKIRELDMYYSGWMILSKDIDLTFTEKDNTLNVTVDVTPKANEARAKFSFSGSVQNLTGTIDSAANKMKLHLIPVKGKDLVIALFEDHDFDRSTMGQTKVLAGQLCAIYTENGQTFSECRGLPTSQALMMVADEGKADGPIRVNDTKTVTDANEIKEAREAYKKEVQEYVDQLMKGSAAANSEESK